MLFAIFVLIVVPVLLNNRTEINFVPVSGLFRPVYEKIIQIFVISSIILGWIGGNPAVSPYITIVS